jgi:HEAT repeat protein
VRSTAATALRQISHPSAAEALSRYAKDPHPRVRNLARPAAPKVNGT